MKEIQLSRGMVALVDDEDFESLNQYKWHALQHRNTFYASRYSRVDSKQKYIRMHGEIMNGSGIDHIDHNGLNNQKSNLRFCTNSENAMNRIKMRNTSSIYKGVTFHKPNKKWMAQIKINGNKTHIGMFTSEIEAAKAYNAKAIELFLEFANLNIIPNE